MFLTNPNVDELQELDLSTLFDMLAFQTTLHFKLLKTGGLSSIGDATRELILNIQAAIEIRKNRDQVAGTNATNATFSQVLP